MTRAGLLAALFAASLAAGCGSIPGTEAEQAPTTGEAGKCATCHMADFRSARGHEGKRPTTCLTCHLDSAWEPSRLDHEWPLTGAHEKAECFACHVGTPAVFLGTKKDCVDCHRKDYEKAARHVEERFSTACTDCHDTAAWKPALEPPPHIVAPPPPSATPSATAPPPPPPPKPKPKPKPKPIPTVTPPDILVGPSGR